jgi:hypothetical protein
VSWNPLVKSNATAVSTTITRMTSPLVIGQASAQPPDR